MKILISACLLGDAVRYDGKAKPLNHAFITRCLSEGLFIKLCPEIAGGLSVPRAAVEIDQQSGKVITQEGKNVSLAFNNGAQAALKLIKQHNIQFALLKSNSPSCGNDKIYDGIFTNTLIEGMGITAALLSKHGVNVFNEHQLDELEQLVIKQHESNHCKY